jgi:hypothetical protein
MSDPKPEVASPEAAEDADIDAIEAIEARGDVTTLLARAKDARADKDMTTCLACYEAAARLGSGDAHYAAALFYLSGQVVAQDLKRGTTHLRAAAEAGVLPARVYLGNLYELGIHYTPDVEKADVWYRSAARAAGIADDMEEDERVRRLADLGCVRAYLELATDESTTEDQRGAWSKKARALGYGLKAREDARAAAPARESLFATMPEGIGATQTPARTPALTPTQTPTQTPALTPTQTPALAPMRAPTSTHAETPVAKGTQKADEAKGEKPKTKAKAGASRFTPMLGLRAFFLEVLFFATGVAAGWLAMEGAKIVIADRGALPVLGDQPVRAFAIMVALVGVLPALLVYRVRTLVASLGAAAALAGIGFALHGSPVGTWIASRALQTSGFATAGFLAALLVFGLFGGAKPPKPAPKDL